MPSNAQNSVAGAGIFTTADDRVYVRPSGQIQDIDKLGDTLIRVNGRNDPPRRHRRPSPAATPIRQTEYMRFGNHDVLGHRRDHGALGRCDRAGQGARCTKPRGCEPRLPAGLKLVQVSSMPHAVGRSIDDFVEAVAEAIGIVLVVSLISLGFRTGMVVVISIPLVLAATALCMYLFHIGLHKVSLGTLILALGLLVDDAIIAVETMAVKLEQGFDRLHAAAFAYTSTAFPMLTGTLVTVSGFLPIALAKSGNR